VDQSKLIEVLASKYDIDISTDIKVMALFNKLCMSVHNEKTIQELDKGATEAGEYFHAELEKKVNSLDQVSDCLIDLLTGDLSPIVKAKVKRITSNYKIGIDRDKEGQFILKLGVYSKPKRVSNK
jgi:hypothetical protein